MRFKFGLHANVYDKKQVYSLTDATKLNKTNREILDDRTKV